MRQVHALCRTGLAAQPQIVHTHETTHRSRSDAGPETVSAMPGESMSQTKLRRWMPMAQKMPALAGYYRVLGRRGTATRTDVLPADKNDAPHHGKGERHHEHGVEPPKRKP